MSPQEYADYRGVHRTTVYRWMKKGRLKVEQTGGPNGSNQILLDKIGEGRLWPAKDYPQERA